MWIICLADDLHELWSLIFPETKNLFVFLFFFFPAAVVIAALRVNICKFYCAPVQILFHQNTIALDTKILFFFFKKKVLIFFLFFYRNTRYENSSAASNEYPQHSYLEL